jgi:hypothetical protein
MKAQWIVAGGLLVASTASASPTTTSFGGRILSASGAPLDSVETLRISLHTASSGGSEVWFEQHSVDLDAGYFNVVLGATTPLRPVLRANGALWVEVSIGGTPTGPRTPLNAAPYSILDSLGGLSCNTGDGIKYNATTQAWECNPPVAAPVRYDLVSMQVFDTAGTHTWTRPPNVRRVEVIVTGGGGGGGSHNTDDAQGGGGAGGTAIEILDVTSTPTVTVTVGVGGNGSCGNSFGGSSGGTSSFGTFLSATGGAPPTTWAIGGNGGQGSGGTLNLRGNDGGTGSIDGGGNEEAGGTGGASIWGGGGSGGSYWGPKRAGVHGSGGGGTHPHYSGGGADCGGNGGPGIVVVREYGG